MIYLAFEFFKIIALGSGVFFLIIIDFDLFGELLGGKRAEQDELVSAPAKAFLALFVASSLFYFWLH